MSGRAHQRKRGLSMQCRARGFNGRAGGFFRILVDVWMSRRVEIEILGGPCNSLDVFRLMGSQQFFFCRGAWLAPFPFSMPILQWQNRAGNTLRPFRMSRA